MKSCAFACFAASSICRQRNDHSSAITMIYIRSNKCKLYVRIYLFLSGIIPAIADVLSDGGGKQNWFLTHQSNVFTEP